MSGNLGRLEKIASSHWNSDEGAGLAEEDRKLQLS